MTNQVNANQHLGEVILNGKSYRHVRMKDSSQPYKTEYFHEPPWDKDSSEVISEPAASWHLGGFKTQPGLPNTSEYGQNTDTRYPTRILPSAAINTITLTGTVAQPTSFAEALGYLWVTAGRYVYRINPADNTVVQSKDFGGAVNSVQCIRWESDFLLVTTDAASNSLWKCTAVGSPDTWTQTVSSDAYRLAVGINRLFKINKTGTLKNIITTLDPMDETKYGDSVQIGDTISPPTSLIAYDRTVVVGKAEGLFGVGEEGFGIPLIRRMVRDASNCLGSSNFDPWVLIPHVRGLYRWQPGQAQASGIELESVNQSPVRGRINCIVPDGDWVYAFMTVGSDTYVLVGRERKPGEVSFGPMIWDTWLFLTAKLTKACYISGLWTNPRLFFGYGNDVAYVNLSAGGGAPDVNGSDYTFSTAGGTRFSSKYRFNDWGSKDFPKIVVVAKNVDANRYWQVAYSIDGGAYQTTDLNGNAMNIQTAGRTTFDLPTTAYGREIQYRFTWVSNSASSPPELNYYEPFADPAPRMLQRITFGLSLAANQRYQRGIETRTASQQLADLQTVMASPNSFVGSGPWGDNVNLTIEDIKIVQESQRGITPEELMVELTVRFRKTAS